MALDEWAEDTALLRRLLELVRSERPTTVVEFGCGASTVVLASARVRPHRGGPRVVSFDHDPDRIARTRDALTERGLERAAVITYLPLDEQADGAPWYVLTDEAVELLNRHPPEMIFVGGPALDSGGSRLDTVDLVAPFLRRDVTLLLEDALHDAGLLVGQAWERRDEIVIHGIRPTARGLLEATLRARHSGRSHD